MTPTPHPAPAMTLPTGNWLTRGLRALIIERRLPYRAAVAVDRLARSFGFTHKTIRPSSFRLRIRRLTCDEDFARNVLSGNEYTPPGSGYEVQPGWTVIDVGANIGTFSLLASRRAGPTGRVIAFEPDGDNYSLLTHNLTLNRADNVTAHHAVAADKAGAVRLFLADEGGYHSVVPGRAADPARFVDVKSVPLADVLDAAGCDLLKLDCEGAEYDILYALPPERLSRVRRIVMEYHGETADDAARASDKLISHLQATGFHVDLYTRFALPFRGGMIRCQRTYP